MIGFKEYITESADEEILKMFDPIKKLLDLVVDDTDSHQTANKLYAGAVEPWAGGYINIKTKNRDDVLRRQIPKPVADKYGIVETNYIDLDMAKNIIKLFKAFPIRYERWNFAGYWDLIEPYGSYTRFKKLDNRPNKNLIIWLLKHMKLDIVMSILDTDFDDYDELADKAYNYAKKIYLSINLDEVSMDKLEHNNRPRRINTHSVRQDFFHYMSLNIPAINSYDPKNNSINYVFSHFSEIENEWKARESATEISDLDGITELFKFGDGTAWFNLNKEYCSIEGNAMRHCGNSAAWEEGDRVLSLRKVNKNETHYPLLTFVVHKDGSLGEAKAKANTRPPQIYHKHIIKLLTFRNPSGDWFIKKIVGGKYLTGNDFKVDDLSKANRVELQSIRPDLVDPQEKEND